MDMMQVKKTVSKNVAALLVMGLAVTMGAGMTQTAEAAAFDPNRPAAMQQGEDGRAPQAKEKTPNKKVKKAPKKEAGSPGRQAENRRRRHRIRSSCCFCQRGGCLFRSGNRRRGRTDLRNTASEAY